MIVSQPYNRRVGPSDVSSSLASRPASVPLAARSGESSRRAKQAHQAQRTDAATRKAKPTLTLSNRANQAPDFPAVAEGAGRAQESTAASP